MRWIRLAFVDITMSYASFLNRVHYVSEIHFRENGEIVVFLIQPACMRFTDLCYPRQMFV